MLECVNLLELGIYNFIMCVDIGVVILLLYVDNIEEFKCDDECWIWFDIYFDIYDVVKIVWCEYKVLS